ncbi:MAG: GTP 3',8-cyclase MoaA [Candidatus Lokiarchaeota archaeon]|nr:GTP 3',8-cyclase MoaA [Candidatus Lokiarchaeota archaeon]MBD3200215.1 GTP 3',8-cyclase MoaA [Candidatus Lokiarchaeota archaeon]
MKDKCEREIKHIRFSVTDKCNYNCIYCDKEGFISKSEELTVQEITEICRNLAIVLNLDKIKFTGGEPLCRKEIVDIIRNVKDLNLYLDMSMTTNGHFLADKAEELYKAGLNRINISLSSLNPAVYKEITGKDNLNRVLKGIKKAKEVGFNPIKINFVVLKGLNDDELQDMISFTANNELVLQLIELHSRSDSIGKHKDFYDKSHVDLSQITKSLEERAIGVKKRGNMQNRKIIFLPDGGIVEVIHPGHNFCMGCTKLRVGCDGNLFGCLYQAETGKNIREGLQNHNSLSQFKEAVKQVVESREPYY